MMAGLLAVPALALGVTAVATPQTAEAAIGITEGRNASKPTENVPTSFTGSRGYGEEEK